MLLALDTATHAISIALHDGVQLLAETSWVTSNNHTVELSPAIADLLKRSAATVYDLTALAVATGPGTYSGLRIGVSVAKAIASARNLPLIGLSVFDVLASASGYFNGTLSITVQAGRGRVIATPYRWTKGRWKARTEPENTDWPTLIASFEAATLLTGDVDAGARALITAAQAEGKPITLASPSARLRRAGWLADEAWSRLHDADGKNQFPAAHVMPVYIKTKDSP